MTEGVWALESLKVPLRAVLPSPPALGEAGLQPGRGPVKDVESRQKKGHHPSHLGVAESNILG